MGKGKGESKWVNIKYERFLNFCFIFRRIGYIDKDCTEEEEMGAEEVIYYYGFWLKASFLKMYGRFIVEES